MKNARHMRWPAGFLTAALFALTVQVGSAQTTMPSTQRFGSGYLDVPAASVLPHLAIQGTFSGFFTQQSPTLVADQTSGAVIGLGPRVDNEFRGDASLTVGLFDRLELGAGLAQTGDIDNGGNMFAYFGRLALLKPKSTGGLGLAVGARYNDAPNYDNGFEYQPNRLGYADRRVRGDYNGAVGESFDSELTLYGVGTVNVAGPDVSWLPKNDVTLSGGYGNGLFQEGDDFAWHSFTDSDGWFGAISWAWGIGDSALIHLITEWNGFDWNSGVQFDVNGFRFGAQLLGMNHTEDLSVFRSTKFGVLASVALCPTDGFLCETRMVERLSADTVQLPAPAPDTVVVTREVAPELPTGSPANICLATGQSVQVLLTAQGDTLVGPGRVSAQSLRPGVVFAGTYADGRAWFENDESVTFEERSYDKSGQASQMQCNQIMRVGEFQGVPLFSMRNAQRPFEMLYVPVRPGIFQPYETGLQSTRGDR